jgi:exodeoxyribonuclease V alpha subunit
MLDLALAERVLAALTPDTRLVLLGDPDQLPSVDPGAVLADLVASSASIPIAHLTVSHRTDARDPGGADVRRVAAAIRQGSLDASALRPIDDPALAAAHGSGVALLRSARDRPAFYRATFAERFAPILELARAPFDLALEADRTRLEACLARLTSARILTVTRTGTTGGSADGANARFGRLALDAMREDGFAPGEPLLAHRNDYDRELLNGDQGMVARVGGRLMAVFLRAGQIVQHPLEAVLGTVERAYATTVHKAQGSEHDHVTLVLPDDDVPLLLGRALLYTAVTRARRSVLIVGDPVLLERGVKRASHRVTGLRTALARSVVGNGQPTS